MVISYSIAMGFFRSLASKHGSFSVPDRRSALWMAVVFIIVVVLDYVSKLAVLRNFRPGEVKPIIENFFNLTLHFNPGVAFGFMADFEDGVRQASLMFTTLFALSLVVYFLFFEYSKDRVGQIALAMILGGAAGNLIDRSTIGQVVDFLDFYWKNWHWPAFNVADSAICIGVFLLIVKPPVKTQPPGA